MHRVAVCVVDAAGEERLAAGEVDVPVFLRSAAKPFIAAAVVATGAPARFGFSDPEIAVMSASHGGEPFHVEAVSSMLAKIGLDAAALQCGAQAPAYEPAAAALAASGHAPSALHNNCSGKHAGLLAACVHLGVDTGTYLEAAHPVERLVLAFCARMTGEDPATLPLGIDGCGMPVFATSLRRGARAFARLATLSGIEAGDAAALERVRRAIQQAPAYVGGTARFDSALPVVTQGRVVGKAGAEGVHGDALLDLGAGVALKVLDGSRRAVAPAVVATLRRIGALDGDAVRALADFGDVDIRNWAGRPVGRLAASFADTFPGTRPS